MSSTTPTNPLVSALLTDLYQITMCYAYYKAGKLEEPCVFELFFRQNPFDGAFTVVAGMDEVVKHLETFSFTPDDIEYLKSVPSLQHAEEGFWAYLVGLSSSEALTVRALPEGSLAFPRVPIVIVEAPLGLGQLLETTLLNLINYPSLITTNAARMVMRAAPMACIEFGLRRAQGPDGAMSASKYSYLGGFVATSNMQAGKVFGIPVAGTHAHAFVQSFVLLEDAQALGLLDKKTGQKMLLLPTVLQYRAQLLALQSNDGELAAFCAYATAFPDACLCLIDTYDTLRSGLLNFCAVALALDDFGYTAKGVRLDSGNLQALSIACQSYFQKLASEMDRPFFRNLTVVASNDINEDSLEELRHQEHGITTLGIGTNLVTCQKQPALGCVFKLVELKGQPRMKLSQDLPKVTIPGSKKAYRLFDIHGQMMLDIMILASESAPVVNERFLCRDPFSNYRCVAIPTRVVELHKTIFQAGQVQVESNLEASRRFVKEQLETLPEQCKAYSNPQNYPVFVSQGLADFLRELWEREAPLDEKM